MTQVKVQKTSSYFRRFQVKNRRRREGKTNYHARHKMIFQEKRKYNAPKYRVIVRCLNSEIIAQIAYATVAGDVIISSASSKELKKYGVLCGYKNFCSAYAVGLLLARKTLKKLKIDGIFKPSPTEKLGERYDGNEEVGRRAFTANLDIGLARATKGSRIFVTLKGVVDGGVNVPYSEKLFYGYDESENKTDSSKLRKRILGEHVSNYMKTLYENNPEAYSKRFSTFIKNGISWDKVQDMYEKAIDLIKKDPNCGINQNNETRKERRLKYKQKLQENNMLKTKPKRMSKQERREKAIEMKKQYIMKIQDAGNDESDDTISN